MAAQGAWSAHQWRGRQARARVRRAVPAARRQAVGGAPNGRAAPAAAGGQGSDRQLGGLAGPGTRAWPGRARPPACGRAWHVGP